MKKIFLIGAAKSGTTKLADMLDCSPDICLSNPKEPDYFSKRIYDLHDDFWYESLFKKAATKFQLDASTSYTAGWNNSSLDTAERIYNYSNDAEIIYLTRDPIKRAWSSYWHSKRTGAEKETAQNSLSNLNSHHIQASLYHKRITEYLQFFPANKIHIISFEEFISSPDKIANILFKRFNLSEVEFTIESQKQYVNESYEWSGIFNGVKIINLKKLIKLNRFIKSISPTSFHQFIKKIVSKPVPKITPELEGKINKLIDDDYQKFLTEFWDQRIH
jgi:hypothetical protein